MHTGEPCGKQGIELLCIVPVKAASVYVGQPLFVAASRNHPLLNSAAELVD